MYLIEYLRKSLNLGDKKSIFVQVRSKITDMSQTLGNLYDNLAEEDGFIYIEVKSESTFGASHP